MFPPLLPLLRQRPYSDYFGHDTFDQFVHSRIRVEYVNATRGRSIRATWEEPLEDFNDRVACMRRKNNVTCYTEKRKLAVDLMDNFYAKMLHADCEPGCEVPSKQCAQCKKIRGVLKKYYLEGVTKTVFGRVSAMFVARQGPFQDCPVVGLPACYEDTRCQIDQLAIARRAVTLEPRVKKNRKTTNRVRTINNTKAI
jgi:hypothetical protein